MKSTYFTGFTGNNTVVHIAVYDDSNNETYCTKQFKKDAETSIYFGFQLQLVSSVQWFNGKVYVQITVYYGMLLLKSRVHVNKYYNGSLLIS